MVAKLVSLAVVVSAVLAVGCTPDVPRLDCSSADAMRTSLGEMNKSLNEDEKKQLAAAIIKAITPGIKAAAEEFAATKRMPGTVSKEELMTKFSPHLTAKHLHGKSAKEILALANGPNSPPPPPPPPSAPPPPAAQ
jgi:hypothetical protein